MSLVTDEKGNELARWYLLSNVFDVDATEIAMWYCHRWSIESWFKLLKTNGHQLEKWQQTTGELILKRLIVASVATTLVFKLYSDKSGEENELKGFFSEIKRAFNEAFKASDTFSPACWSLGVLTNVRGIEHLQDRGNQQDERVSQFVFCSICVGAYGLRGES